MAAVSQLLRHILKLQPQNSAARLALYHYVKNLKDPEAEAHPELIRQFISRALHFPYWMERKHELSFEIQSILESYQAETGFAPQAWLRTRMPETLQVLRLENPLDLYQVIKKYSEDDAPEGAQCRVLPDQDRGVVVLTLYPSGVLRIGVYDFNVVIHEGRVIPLCEDRLIYYDRELELSPNVPQLLDVAPYAVVRFRSENGHCTGQIVKGYLFNSTEKFEARPLNTLPQVFYPLKRLERFFVNRATDPLYKELTTLLEEAIHLLVDQGADALGLARTALNRGQSALEHIFVDDKLLFLLVRELSRSIDEAARESRRGVPDAPVRTFHPPHNPREL